MQRRAGDAKEGRGRQKRKKESKFIYLLLAINMVIKITTGTYLFILTWQT